MWWASHHLSNNSFYFLRYLIIWAHFWNNKECKPFVHYVFKNRFFIFIWEQFYWSFSLDFFSHLLYMFQYLSYLIQFAVVNCPLLCHLFTLVQRLGRESFLGKILQAFQAKLLIRKFILIRLSQNVLHHNLLGNKLCFVKLFRILIDVKLLSILAHFRIILQQIESQGRSYHLLLLFTCLWFVQGRVWIRIVMTLTSYSLITFLFQAFLRRKIVELIFPRSFSIFFRRFILRPFLRCPISSFRFCCETSSEFSLQRWRWII